MYFAGDTLRQAESRRCRNCGNPLMEWVRASVCPACMLQSVSAPEPDAPDGETGGVLAEAAAAGGRILGNYRLEEEIAHGGMGVVYRATQLGLNRTVAVKLLLMGRYASPDSRIRFQREAQAAAVLSHPNIVSVIEVGEIDGEAFIAMEYVSGVSMAEMLRRNPLPARQAAQWLLAVTDAIRHAHAHGILHRDIKPSNLLIDEEGTVRVTDFGMAKRLDGSGDMTRSDEMMGTPNYLPPEVARGGWREAQEAGDIYSIGAVLYELLTGRPPFLADSVHETLRRIIETDPVPLRTLNPGIPQDLETICLKSLAKDPARRFGSATELADELRRWLNGMPILTRPPGPIGRLGRWVRRRPALATLSLVTVCAAAGALGTLIVANREIGAASRQAAAEAAAHRRNLTRMHIMQGNRLAEEREHSAALLRFAEALRLAADDPDAAVMQRRRYAAARRAAPDLLHLWATARAPGYAHYSRTGEKVIFASGDGAVGIFDAVTGAQRLPFRRLEYSVVEAWFDRAVDGIVWAGDSEGRLHRLHESTLAPAGPVIPSALEPTAWLTNGLNFDYADHRVIVVRETGVQVFNSLTCQPEGDVAATAHRIASVRFAPSDELAAAGATDGTVFLIQVPEGIVRQSFRAGEAVRRVVFAQEDRFLLVTTRERGGDEVTLWDLSGPTRRWSWHVGGSAYACRISPDGRLASIGAGAGETVVVDIETGAVTGRMRPHPAVISSVAFDAASEVLMSASNDGRVRFWNAESGLPVLSSLGHSDLVLSSRFHPDGLHVLTTGREPLVRQWRLPPAEPARLILKHENRITGAHLDAVGNRIITADSAGVRIWSRRDGSVLRTLPHPAALTATAFDSVRRRLLTGCEDGTARLWSLDGSDPDPAVCRTGSPVERVAISPDGSVCFLACRDGSIHRWQPDRGFRPAPFRRHKAPVRILRLSPDGARVVSVDATSLMFISRADGREAPVVLRHPADVKAVGFSPDSRLFITACTDDTIEPRPAHVRELETGMPAGPPFYQNDGLRGAMFSPDGRLVVTCGDDGSAVIRNAADGAALVRPLRHRNSIHDAVFSPDGTMVLTRSADDSVRVWEVATGDPVTPPLFQEWGDGTCEWSPDSREFLVASGNVARLWDVSPAEGPVSELIREAELLSSSRLDERLGPVPLEPAEVIARTSASLHRKVRSGRR